MAPKITATPYPSCSGPNGCAFAVEKGGWVRPYMGAILDQRVGPNGQRYMMPVTNASGPSILQTTLPVVLGAWGSYQAVRASAGGINIYNKGGDAQALQQTGVDVVQNPHDPDTSIDDVQLYPAPPGN
jgi:hypothetical protein